MWCLVSQPNSVILEIKVDPKATGKACLEKVCTLLGLCHELDYFGLKYTSLKGIDLWLNLRNSIDHQFCGVPPFRLALRVKFWVPPHLLLQDASRHQFYLNIKSDLRAGRLQTSDLKVVVYLVALMAQAEVGDFSPESSEVFCKENYLPLIDLFGSQVSISSPDVLQNIITLHGNLTGMKSSAAKYWILKEVSAMPGCGEDLFHTRIQCGYPCPIGVGPHGITFYNTEKERKESLSYSAVTSIGFNRRVINLRYLNENSAEHNMELKLDSSVSAISLYRAIIEKHAFYSCETVGNAVSTQTRRDLKGTIASIFKEGSTVGVEYVFDIQRTCREVYDNTRRVFHDIRIKNELFPKMPGSFRNSRSQIDSTAVKGGQDYLKNESFLHETMICRICMDRRIDAATFPCAHVMSCITCAQQCKTCPLCRAHIIQVKRIFLPLDILPKDDPELAFIVCASKIKV